MRRVKFIHLLPVLCLVLFCSLSIGRKIRSACASEYDYAHQLHLDPNNFLGPGLGADHCTKCHDRGITFDDPPSTSNVEYENCYDCHSVDGQYNGVFSLNGSVGAKDNWRKDGTESEIYDPDGSIKEGKGKWCIGCHDDGYSDMRNSTAPNIAGMNYQGDWQTPTAVIEDCCTLGSPENLIDGDLETGNSSHGYVMLALGNDSTVVSHLKLYRGSRDPNSVHEFFIYAGDSLTNCADSGWGTKIGVGVFGWYIPPAEGWYQTRMEKFIPKRYIKIMKGRGGPLGKNTIMEIKFKSDIQFGYYLTGHKIGCDLCHDARVAHFDHQRTYNVNSNNYQIGYRLKEVEIEGNYYPALEIPREGSGNPTVDNDFALCFSCHDQYKLLGDPSASGDYYQDPIKTNFRDDNDGRNDHYVHLLGVTPSGGISWDSDWNGSADSPISCPACHNVHGSPSPAMNRHGELVSTPNSDFDKVPMYDLHYKNLNGKLDPDLLNPLQSIAGNSRFYRGKGAVSENHVCDMCHNSGLTYYREVIATSISECQSCHTTMQEHPSHATHLEVDARGPSLACTDCHSGNCAESPHLHLFADGKPLANTTVCDNCHSPEGDFDGINPNDIGAKPNWQEGVYDEGRVDLKEGKENWCASCHDNGTSICSGVAAPNVMGDNSTYGYNISGHKIVCSGCHDLTSIHIDGEARTYSHDSDPFDSEDLHNYQNGYRLRAPMIIPLGVGPLGGWGRDSFALCFECHDYNKLFSGEPYQTNFYDENKFTSHRYHLSAGPSAWDSDWDYLLAPTEIIIDNSEVSSDWSSSNETWGYYGSDYQYYTPGMGEASFTWTPTILKEGEYKVFARWTSSEDRASDAKFTIVYNGGESTTTVDQQIDGGKWNLLGTFSFVEGTSGFVKLSNEATGFVVADAVKFGDAILDSRISCPACHNVHGSPSPAMIRHGELISTSGAMDKVPALNFRWYESSGYNVTQIEQNSLYGDMPVLGGPGGGALEASKVCAGCHAGPNPITYKRVYQELEMPLGFDTPPLPPSIRSLNPQEGAQEVAADRKISFIILTDGFQDIDWSNSSVSLQGSISYSQTYTDSDSEMVVDTISLNSSYQVMVTPDVCFGDNELITVTVKVADEGDDTLTSSWFFTTGDSSQGWQTPVAVYKQRDFLMPELLIDDNPQTGNNKAPFGVHWVIFDLGASYQVNQVRVLLSSVNERMWTINIGDNPSSLGDGTVAKRGWQVKPDALIIDNPEAELIGAWTLSREVPGFFRENYHEKNTTAEGNTPSTCIWRPEIIQAGDYYVFARWTGNSSRAQDARYVITHKGGTDTVIMNQKENWAKWNLLGTYNFVQGELGTISLSNISNDTSTTVVADAVRLVKKDSLPLWRSTPVKPLIGRYLKLYTDRGPLEEDTLREIDFSIIEADEPNDFTPEEASSSEASTGSPSYVSSDDASSSAMISSSQENEDDDASHSLPSNFPESSSESSSSEEQEGEKDTGKGSCFIKSVF